MNAVYWLSNLAAWSAQAAVLIAAGSAAAWAFRLRAPRVRLAYGQVLLAVCLLLPAVEPWQVDAGSRISITTHTARPVAPARTSPHFLNWRLALLIALAAGCAGRALWLAIGFGRLRQWRLNSDTFSPLPLPIERLRDALAPQAELLISSSISGPVTFGLRRPVVVFPRRFAELPAEIQEAVACHELLHVRRRDWIVTVVEEAIRAALWFHPGVWWLISQVQLAREQAVDSEVVAYTRNRAQYLNALLAIAGNQPALDLAPATLFLRKRHLKNRVALLMKEVTMSKRTLISFCATSGALLLAAGWLAFHTFPLQAAPVPQEQGDRLLHRVAPRYPPEARAKNIDGDVVLEVRIDADGHVTDARVLSGPDELRRAALEAVLQWHYSPKAMALPATTQETVGFKLPATLEGAVFTLKGIQVEGLSASAREELLQRLPVHVGDMVDMNAMQSVGQAVRAFDEHLSVSASPNEGMLRVFVGPPKIRIGGNVQQSKLRVKVQPVYPPEAKAQGMQGVVRLEATLDKSGNVANLKVLEGDPVLAAAAMEAVRQWQYQTTLLNGDPVEVVTQIDVNFTLAK